MIRPHWTDDYPRDKKYLLDRNEAYDTIFNAHLTEFLKGIDCQAISHYPCMSTAYKSLSRITGITAANLFLTSGSEQAIKAILDINAYVGKIVFPEPTFKMVDVHSQLLGFKRKKLYYKFYKTHFDIDLDAGDGESIIYLASPDNPTGHTYGISMVEKLCKSQPLVILDEAYCAHTTCRKMSLLQKYDNLYIVRTFSKYGNAAGLRIGYVISSESNINKLYTHKPMYEISTIAEKYLQFLSSNIDMLRESYSRINVGKTALSDWLRDCGCKVLRYTCGNFVLFERNDKFLARINDIVATKSMTIDNHEFTRITAPSVDCVRKIKDYASRFNT